MKRFAAHSIFIPPDQLLKLHWIELDEKNCFSGVFPLNKEIAHTSFFNGMLLLSKQELSSDLFLKQDSNLSLFQRLKNQNFPTIEENDFVFLYHLDGINLLSEDPLSNNTLSFKRI